MTFSRENEYSTSNHGELEQRLKPLVQFHGIIHDECNAQSVAHIRTALTEHAVLVGGKVTVFLERTTQPPQRKAILKEVTTQHGHMGEGIIGDLFRELGRWSTFSEVEERRGALSAIDLATDLQTALDRKLLSPKSIFSMCLTQLLDKMKETSPIEVDWEVHSEDVAKRIVSQQDSYKRLAMRSFECWRKGSFALALLDYKEHRRLIGRTHTLREGDLVSTLRQKMQVLGGSQPYGSLFILFGANHEPMVAELSRGVAVPSAIYRMRAVVPRDLPHVAIDRALRARKSVPEIVYARALLLDVLHNDLASSIRSSDVAYYAYHLEDAYRVLTDAVNSVSLEDIRSLCESRRNPLTFLEEHPIGESLFYYDDEPEKDQNF